MILKSYIFSTTALVLAIFVNKLVIILPFCFIFALLGLYYGVNNYRKNKDQNDFIVNLIPLACSGFVIISLIFLSLFFLV